MISSEELDRLLRETLEPELRPPDPGFVQRVEFGLRAERVRQGEARVARLRLLAEAGCGAAAAASGAFLVRSGHSLSSLITQAPELLATCFALATLWLAISTVAQEESVQ